MELFSEIFSIASEADLRRLAQPVGEDRAERARQNGADTSPVDTPVLYVRGDAERVDLEEYLAGFRAAGHSSSLESPEALWQEMAAFFLD